MSERSSELASRRRELLARSDMQRATLASATREIQTRLNGIDHVIDLAKRFVAKPILLAGGLAVVMLLGPRRLIGWAGRGVLLFSSGRRLLKRLR